jgi:hypothetical protein
MSLSNWLLSFDGKWAAASGIDERAGWPRISNTNEGGGPGMPGNSVPDQSQAQ